MYLDCSIQPKAREDKIVGLIANRIKIRLKAPPIDGKANKYLVKYLAKLFKVKQNAITIVSGHSSRQKRLCIVNPSQFPESLDIDLPK